jgi:hypothetical protein
MPQGHPPTENYNWRHMPMNTEAAANETDRTDETRDRTFTVIVNGRKKQVKTEYLSFDDVVNLRFDNNPPQGDNWVFTITYRNGPRENPKGSLTRGNKVKIKDGMIFDVTATDKS